MTLAEWTEQLDMTNWTEAQVLAWYYAVLCEQFNNSQ